jgi:AmiR/NasT family two-component response regulator
MVRRSAGADGLPQVWTYPGDRVQGDVEVNRMIGAAVGMIMGEQGLSYAEAADRLRELSRDHRSSLFAEAARMTLTSPMHRPTRQA